MPTLSFEQEVLAQVNEVSEKIQAIGINVQNQLTDEQKEKYLQIMKDATLEYANICALHSLHLLETSSLLLQKVTGATEKDRSDLDKICAHIDQFVSLVKARK